MAVNTTQSSFIPKRGAARSNRRKPVRQVFIFTIFAYSVTFAALLASGASYLYKNYTTSLLENEVSALNSEINTFSVSGLSTVREFDLTLQRAADRLSHTASVVTVLDALDDVVVAPAQIKEFSFERQGDNELLIEIDVAAQSFDSAIFQRKILNTDDRIFSSVLVEDVMLALANNESEGDVSTETSFVGVDQPVSFTATLRAPIEAVPYGGIESEQEPALNSASNQTAI